MMSSIVAGSTYLLAPPPKSPSHNHFIASILCRPIKHPHLLLQLQRKDPDTRHASPQFDLVCRRSGKLSRKDLERNPQLATIHNGRRPREVAIQQSETHERIAVIKYVNALNSAHKRRLEIAPDDNSIIAVISWYSRSVVKEWTVHRYEAKRKGNKIIGYEFRTRSDRVQDGKGIIYVRWTRKVLSIQERPRSVSSRHHRSDSVSSSEGPRRRHTFAATPTKSANPPSDPKWEFSSPNCRRIMASMTSQRLHINSLSSSGTPSTSPSNSDLDEDFQGDREMTSGRIMEFLILSGLFVGFEEDFASKLRKEFLSAATLRVRSSTEFNESPAPEVPIIRSPKKVRPALAPVQSIESSYERPRQTEQYHTPEREVQIESVRTSVSSTIPTTIVETANYASRGWGYMSACVTKLMSLAA